MKAPFESGGGDFAPTPAGNHVARAYSLVDLGVQSSDYGDKRQIVVTWELLEELMEDGRPFVISKFYTLSLHPKATLCQDVEAMYGKTIPDHAKAEFDFQNILNHPCMVNVIHETKNDKTRAKISGLSPTPKSMKAPKLTNDIVFFDLDEPDWNMFEDLPDWIKKKVNKDLGDAKKPEPNKSDSSDDDPDDDIPF